MRIAILGGGPAGLFLALLLKRRRPRDDVQVIEQNARGATFGFGVVFSDGALDFLRSGEPEVFAALEAGMERWPEQKIVHRDEAIAIDGNGFSAVGRLALLEQLQRLAAQAGVQPAWQRSVAALDELKGFDLVVAADGVNSLVRRALAPVLQPRTRWLSNKFAWYGTRQPFDCLTLTFRASEHGHFVAHHYRYAPDMSTFIVECDAATWHRAGFERMGDDDSRAYCERVFAADLGGAPLISNKSIWRNFPLLWTPQWTTTVPGVGPVVLIGDAVRTGHFSIGSGTRLAMEDSIALAAALATCGDDVAAGLAAFERERKPIAEKIVHAADASSYWYERLADKMKLAPWQLAYDYMTRSGRMGDERLRAMAPRFMARVDRERAADPAAAHPERQRDPCHEGGAQGEAGAAPAAVPGAREIGWPPAGLAGPEGTRYNASRLLFDNLAAGRGGKVALICGDRRVTYAELAALAARAGQALHRAGLARGSRVLLLMLDTPEYVAAIFGALRAGFVPVLVNTLSPADLVAYYLGDSGAEVAIAHASLAPLLTHADVRASRLRQLVVVDEEADGTAPLPPAPALERVEVVRWVDWVQGIAPALDEAPTHPDEMAFWMYSSGSTGRPKGVVHLHHDAPYTQAAYGERVLGLRESDIVFSPPKVFFAYGFGNALTFPFAVGATTVLHPGRPDPEAVFAVIERHRPTVLFGLPTLYSALIAHPGSEQRQLSSLRLCISAAETLSREMFGQWQRRTGLSIVEGLGSTEVLHIYLSNRVDRQKPGASGARVPGYEIRLCTPEGEKVPRGEPGILWVRGDSNAPFYWNRPDKTSETMRAGGWIVTGDRFREDEDGFFWFEGRADDVVKVSGQWVHPLEVERALAEHPAVRECAVLALEDEHRLMTLKAWVALRPGHAAGAETTKALQAFVKRALVPFKYPRTIEYLHELPKTGTDKIDRQRLKAGAGPAAAP